jgi:(p)ppGpp synthase/HD superfamily hydrolase
MRKPAPSRTTVAKKQLSDRIGLALQVAFDLHRDQYRKGSSIPYLSHLMGVAAVAMHFGATEDEAIAALLHDAIEDRGGPAARALLRQLFGKSVTTIVDECTDTDITPKPPWRTRKEAYIEHIRHASKSALLVSASDKLDNARDILVDYKRIGEKLWARFSGGRDGTLWYYRELVTAFSVAGAPAELVDELDTVVSHIERRVREAQRRQRR